MILLYTYDIITTVDILYMSHMINIMKYKLNTRKHTCDGNKGKEVDCMEDAAREARNRYKREWYAKNKDKQREY